jgi:hypothetical protein
MTYRSVSIKSCGKYSDQLKLKTITVAELKFRVVFFCHFNKISVNHLILSS